MRLSVPLLALALVACDTNNGTSYEQCELQLELQPTTAAVGDPVDVIGSPQSAVLDTNVRVNGVEAEVTDLAFPDECSACDACRTNAECLSCETCEVCADTCAACTPTLTFVVPDVAPGPAGVLVTNLFGTSPPLDLEVTAAAEGQ